VIKLRRMRWTVIVTNIGKMRNAYIILIRKSEGKNDWLVHLGTDERIILKLNLKNQKS
jgi:hypothetical protein